LPTKSSGRRLAKEGGLTIALRYGINYFWIIFFNRPFTKTSDDVRLDNKGAVIYNPENRVREWTIGTVIILILLAFVALIIYLIRHALGW
jgi:hypothetical protein